MIDKATSMCRLLIGEKLSATDSEIESAIEQVVCMPMFADIDRGVLKLEIHSLYNVQVDEYRMLVDSDRNRPWLKQFKANRTKDDWKFWNRYRNYLETTKGFAPTVIDKVDRITDEILDKLYDPTLDDMKGVDKKGLVVGQVQSGKTANYTGVICKAADAGFNLIIVLAGIHNNLRSQTQHRLDEDFLGFDTEHERAYNLNGTNRIGVGLLDKNNTAISITTIKSDFKRSLADSLGISFDVENPLLVVVKKNSTVLKRLRQWLLTQAREIDGEKKIANKSLLIIDDEADNASINTNKDGDTPTAINNSIRDITGLFYRYGYVGYTATPFANIFIPMDKYDLFPRDFIINIPAPGNYIGPEKIFGTSTEADEKEDDLLPIVRKIDDYRSFVPDRHKKDDPMPDELPESLKTAIKCFIMTCAIRIARGQEYKHNSMLVHVVRFVSWQNHIRELVEEQYNYYKRGIEQEDRAIMEQFREIFEVDTDDYVSYATTTRNIQSSSLHDIDTKIRLHSWEEIRPLLYKAVQKIVVMAINGKSGEALEYYENEQNGISVIAVGGNKLSRGLTLEGLSVSYYLRASKMYDTLMQMGRWFGYRGGYVDLCRLFTSSELNKWFRHITMASEELREDFDYMWKIGATPEKYALKVRTHPGQLQVTAVSKMRNATTIRVSWSGRLIETYQLSTDTDIITRNLMATKGFLGSLGRPEKRRHNYLWKGVSSAGIFDFLKEFRVSPDLTKVDLDRISSFIARLNEYGELTSWRVALMSKEKATKKFILSDEVKVGCFIRRTAEDTDTYVIKKNHILGNPADEFIDLDDDLLKRALERSREDDNNWKKDYPKPRIVREEFRDVAHPLLMLYPLDPRGANYQDKEHNMERKRFSEEDEVIFGFAISFPHSNTDYCEEFAIHTDMVNEYYQAEEDFELNNDGTENDDE